MLLHLAVWWYLRARRQQIKNLHNIFLWNVGVNYNISCWVRMLFCTVSLVNLFVSQFIFIKHATGKFQTDRKQVQSRWRRSTCTFRLTFHAFAKKRAVVSLCLSTTCPSVRPFIRKKQFEPCRTNFYKLSIGKFRQNLSTPSNFGSNLTKTRSHYEVCGEKHLTYFIIQCIFALNL
jgi:hypothetical protein